ncbi:TRIC cation channel family protein [Thermogemmatispora sp.]|uniref:TRIC cation channel family protein n=1 Tax=Thermogemmatispora sp. TaxID=1968838 RepID=UPI0035E459B7
MKASLSNVLSPKPCWTSQRAVVLWYNVGNCKPVKAYPGGRSVTNPSASQAGAARRILRRFRGLQAHLQPGEEPLGSRPVIWHSQEHGAVACDVILTNRRLLGYYQTRFPRSRLFLEAIPLQEITSLTQRIPQSKSLLHELLIISGQGQVLLRAPRRSIEQLCEAIRLLKEGASQEREAASSSAVAAGGEEEPEREPPLRLARQQLVGSAERSPAAIAAIFACGLILEIIAVFLWATTGSLATSLPPFGAGLLAVLTAILVYRQR